MCDACAAARASAREAERDLERLCAALSDNHARVTRALREREALLDALAAACALHARVGPVAHARPAEPRRGGGEVGRPRDAPVGLGVDPP